VPLIRPGDVTRSVAQLLQSRDPTPAQPEYGPYTPSQSYWPPANIADVLLRRKSVRKFAPAVIPYRHLRWTISAAYTAEGHDWPHEQHGDAGLVFLVTAYRVSGLAPGIYAAGRLNNDFRPVATGISWLPDLQIEYAAASALLHVCGTLYKEVEDEDAPGYGALLVRAGALGYAAWLSAISHGYAGSVYAGRSPRINQLAQAAVNGNLRHIFTVAVGVPDQAGSS
jgi:hypothetical protein